MIYKLVTKVIQYFCFPTDLWKVGTSWISRDALGSLKDWENLKAKFSLTNMYLDLTQWKDVISSKWKKRVKQDSSLNNHLFTLDHHVIKSRRCLSIEKLTSKELYSILLLKSNK